MSAYVYVLLCPKEHIPELGLKVYDNNCEETGKICECVLYPEKWCKVTHIQLNNGKSESICGWYAVFKYMNENQLDKMDDYTGKMTKHSFHACPDESKHQGNIFWVDFIKVARNK